MIISFNGSDMSGKTTQAKKVHEEYQYSKLIRSVRHYIPNLPSSDEEIDSFFKRKDPSEKFEIMLEGYKRRSEEIFNSESPLLILDRGKLNLCADLVSNFYPDYPIEDAYKLVREETPDSIFNLDDISIYLKISESTYLSRLEEGVEFTNIEFQRKLFSIYSFLEKKLSSFHVINGSLDRNKIFNRIRGLINEERENR